MRSPFKTILVSGFVAGSLDILAAFFVYSAVQKTSTPVKILEYIASGVFKTKAYSGGIEMAVYGLLFHFCIAFGFAILYFFIFPYIAFLKKQKIVSGILFGIIVWGIMNLIVLPTVFNRLPKITLGPSSIAVLILIIAVGIPISLITHKYYTTKSSAVVC
jgi:uncharacterized membrane protein YagU involved in acid resistance